METLLLTKSHRTSGFSLAEILVAIAVLTIGMSAMAGLVASSLSGTERARYMALATTLVSEKLEDLNRWPSVASQVATGGSLSADTLVGTLNYFDDTDLSSTTGEVSETVAITAGYSTIAHMANGQVTTTNTTAPTGTGLVVFHRRWLIESNPVVNGVTLTGARRVTVIVTGTNLTVQPGITFQMSMIRP
jgi:prepilin-type N-terminal cleavage/methylation domain-containing protein